ncbi:hypothetical protein Hanom_Chr17g01557911 [Helianthus anomalus]
MSVPSVLIFDKDSFFLVVFFIKNYGCSLFFVTLNCCSKDPMFV